MLRGDVEQGKCKMFILQIIYTATTPAITTTSTIAAITTTAIVTATTTATTPSTSKAEGIDVKLSGNVEKEGEKFDTRLVDSDN